VVDGRPDTAPLASDHAPTAVLLVPLSVRVRVAPYLAHETQETAKAPEVSEVRDRAWDRTDFGLSESDPDQVTARLALDRSQTRFPLPVRARHRPAPEGFFFRLHRRPFVVRDRRA
jgi:hypothetical protein